MTEMSRKQLVDDSMIMAMDLQERLTENQKLEISDLINDAAVENSLLAALKSLRANKPTERSEKTRRYAVTITEMEKVYSYFKVYVVDSVEDKKG